MSILAIVVRLLLSLAGTSPLVGADQSRLIPVPAVQGQRLKVAQQMLRLSELRGVSGVFYIAPKNWREDLDPAVVGMQTPQPKSYVPEETTVAMWTFARAAINQKTLAVPDLRGLSRKEAIDRLQKLGLEAMYDPGGNDKSKVIEHYPRPKQTVYERTSVYLRVDP